MKETLKNKPLVIQLGVAVSIVIFLVFWSYNAGTTMERINFEIEDVNNRVDHLSEKYTTVRQDITVLQAQGSDIKARLMTIEAILSRIEQKLK